MDEDEADTLRAFIQEHIAELLNNQTETNSSSNRIINLAEDTDPSDTDPSDEGIALQNQNIKRKVRSNESESSESNEQKTESKEQKTESKEQKTDLKEQKTESKEQKTESKEQKIDSKEQKQGSIDTSAHSTPNITKVKSV